MLIIFLMCSQAVKQLAVLLGDHNLYTLTPSQKFLKVDKMYIHPDFNIPKPLSNDVALMHLPQEIAFNGEYIAYYTSLKFSGALTFLPSTGYSLSG